MSLASKENIMESNEEIERKKREAQREKMRQDIAMRKEQLRLQVPTFFIHAHVFIP